MIIVTVANELPNQLTSHVTSQATAKLLPSYCYGLNQD